MTAAAFHRADPKPASDRTPENDATSRRRLWSEVAMTVLEDSWRAVSRAKGDPSRIAEIRAKALRYFESRDGREVASLAGVTADPERLADAAVDPESYRRTTRLRDGRDA